MRRYMSLVLLALLAAPAAAQERADSAWQNALPPEVARGITEFFNNPRTIHFTGRTRIPAERVVEGDVAVLGGPLTVAGRVTGRVVVVNGDVELLPGAVISEDLTVVGGSISGLENARIGGEALAYREQLRYRRDDSERIMLIREGDEPAPAEERRGWERDTRWGRSDFLITSGQSYNRVEGLPITIGPRIETAGSNPLRVRTLAIYRTESGWTLDSDRLGYYLSAEQFLGGRRAVRVGASAYSMIDPIEDWHVSDLENGLSTFLFRRDYRDHFEREGWSAFATWEPRAKRSSLTAEFRSEQNRSVPVGSPFALFNNDESWRAQPLVGEGRLNSVALRGEYAPRGQTRDPATGWFLRGEIERGLDVDLVRPAYVVAIPGLDAVGPPESYDGFTHGIVDVRRYNRVSPESRLNFRLIAGGSLDGSVLPPQRQHALGGEGSLPGYDLFSRDCGARSVQVYQAEDLPATPVLAPFDAPAYVPAYGCDRFALFQAEYRGKFGLRFGGDRWGDDDDEDGRNWDNWIPRWDSALDWVAFLDAGRGWGAGARPDEPLAVDLGFGVLIERLGIYAAVPLSGGGGLNLFLRLGPRF